MKHDYDLSELRQISVRNLKFNIMPRYLYHYTDKEYEAFSLDLLDRLLEEGGTSVDIGAHYGIYSLLAARKSKKVYAFEPVPENYKILKKNIRDNGFDKVIVPINKATSDTKGKVEFNITWASDSAGFYEHPNAEVIRKISVETNSIDNELKGVKDISFIKIDTEGHELHVLDGMKATLKRNPNAKMLIEFNPECLVNAGTTSQALVNKINRLGYDIFALYEETRYMVRVLPDTSEEDILQGRKYLNFLCLPKGSWQSLLAVSHSSDIGGAELVLLRTLKNFIEKKDTFVVPFVALPGDGLLEAKIKELAIPYQVVPMRGWTNNGGLEPAAATGVKILNANAVATLSKITADFKPDVVLTNTMALPWGAYVANAYGIPHVWSIHEFGDIDHNLKFDYGYEASLRIIDSLSQRVIVNSEAVRDHVARFIDPAKLDLRIPDIALPHFSKKPPTDPFTNSATLRLAITGRVSETKGQLEAIQAVELLRKAGHKAELLVVGPSRPGEYLDSLKASIKKHKLEKYVHFVGFQENPYDYVALSDVVLMCSANEAFGMVTAEAMLLGKPVVGSASGGTKELIDDGKTGLLYEPHNVEQLAKQVTRLADTKFRDALSLAAQKAASRRFPNDYYRQVLQTLQKAQKKPTAPPLPFTVLHDVFTGMYRQADVVRAELEQTVQRHREELANFSDEYNKVYAAYNDVSEHLASLRNNKLVRVYSRAGHLKQRLKNRKGDKK